MKHLSKTLAAAAVLAAGGVFALTAVPTVAADEAKPSDKAESGKIEWAKSIPETSEKPVLVYFTASWCGPCQVMKKEAWADESIIDVADNYNMVMIDIDENPEVSKKHQVRGVPTMIALSNDKEEQDRMVGYASGMQGQVLAFLKKHDGQE
jgi:thiol:disulfide interchange protein